MCSEAGRACHTLSSRWSLLDKGGVPSRRRTLFRPCSFQDRVHLQDLRSLFRGTDGFCFLLQDDGLQEQAWTALEQGLEGAQQARRPVPPSKRRRRSGSARRRLVCAGAAPRMRGWTGGGWGVGREGMGVSDEEGKAIALSGDEWIQLSINKRTRGKGGRQAGRQRARGSKRGYIACYITWYITPSLYNMLYDNGI